MEFQNSQAEKDQPKRSLSPRNKKSESDVRYQVPSSLSVLKNNELISSAQIENLKFEEVKGTRNRFGASIGLDAQLASSSQVTKTENLINITKVQRSVLKIQPNTIQSLNNKMSGFHLPQASQLDQSRYKDSQTRKPKFAVLRRKFDSKQAWGSIDLQTSQNTPKMGTDDQSKQNTLAYIQKVNKIHGEIRQLANSNLNPLNNFLSEPTPINTLKVIKQDYDLEDNPQIQNAGKKSYKIQKHLDTVKIFGIPQNQKSSQPVSLLNGNQAQSKTEVQVARSLSRSTLPQLGTKEIQKRNENLQLTGMTMLRNGSIVLDKGIDQKEAEFPRNLKPMTSQAQTLLNEEISVQTPQIRQDSKHKRMPQIISKNDMIMEAQPQIIPQKNNLNPQTEADEQDQNQKLTEKKTYGLKKKQASVEVSQAHPLNSIIQGNSNIESPEHPQEKTPKSVIAGPVIDIIKKKTEFKVSHLNDLALPIKLEKGAFLGQDGQAQTTQQVRDQADQANQNLNNFLKKGESKLRRDESESKDLVVPDIGGSTQPTASTLVLGVNQQKLDNPMKKYEHAKFASKVHGLITSYAANTHQGIQRNYNEDRVSIILNINKPAHRTDIIDWPKCSFFAIYDGHGGHICADFLKDTLHNIIIGQETFPKDPAQALTTGCLEAERKFLDFADKVKPVHERSGSCAIIVMIVEQECYVANVGDSRAIMSADHGKKLFLLSRDHRPGENYEQTRIIQNGGNVYQTQSIQTNVGRDPTIQLGPHRVFPGRLSVSRTFGDIEAKMSKYGGKEGVIIAQPEISQFTLQQDFHDFIVLGCDGIFDRVSNQAALDVSWDTINQIRSHDMKKSFENAKTIHQVSGAIADSLMIHAAQERSIDNLTIVVISFANLQTFISDRPALEKHLFQIKEVESVSTSQIVKSPEVSMPNSQRVELSSTAKINQALSEEERSPKNSLRQRKQSQRKTTEASRRPLSNVSHSDAPKLPQRLTAQTRNKNRQIYPEGWLEMTKQIMKTTNSSQSNQQRQISLTTSNIKSKQFVHEGSISHSRTTQNKVLQDVLAQKLAQIQKKKDSVTATTTIGLRYSMDEVRFANKTIQFSAEYAGRIKADQPAAPKGLRLPPTDGENYQTKEKKNPNLNKNAIMEMKNPGDYLAEIRRQKKSLTVPQSREQSVALLKSQD